MRPELPTGTVTFLFTDIEGSTRLLHALGPDAYAEALTEHRRVLREAFARHGGVEVDTQGDAFFVAFPTTAGAAAAAREAGDALMSGRVRVRMGLHTGTPSRGPEGYVGVDVHRGARVAALAHGGQILASPTTAALVDGATMLDLGLHRLKDFEGVTRLYQLGTEAFPPLRTPGSVDLPTPATRFLGRELELFEAVSLVYERDPRVLTVLGPGGTGKTRFAIELSRLLAEDAEGGTVFVPLAPLREPGLVLTTIAERLGAEVAEVGAIAARIGDRRTHVLVDNVEHLLPQAASPLAELTAAAPALRLIATSREAPRIQGEVELDLPPLAEGEAVALFCERAQAVRPDLEESETVHELCARLDRLPLALELAAARTKLLSPAALLERLGSRLDLLKGTRDADERHMTLRATIAWSYDLLDENEQQLFSRMSVFRGGGTLQTVEVVCNADLDTLASLLDKSLVRRRTGALGEERFWMLETIKEFAAERLTESGDDGTIRRTHAERMLEIARSANLSEDDDEPFGLEVALAERNDLRSALDWAAENDPELGLELVVALETFWNASAPHEGLHRVADLLRRTVSPRPELRARALRVYGNTASIQRDHVGADARWAESLELFRKLGDERGVAGILHRLALTPMFAGDVDRARQIVDESQSLARGRFRPVECTNYWIYAELARADGRLDEAVEYARLSATTARELQWSWWESGRLDQLSRLALLRGEVDEAEREGHAALRLEREQENRRWSAYTLASLAQVAHARGELVRAGVLWGAAEQEAERLPESEGERAERGGSLLDETRPDFLAAVVRGRALDLWDAVAIALGEDEVAQTDP